MLLCLEEFDSLSYLSALGLFVEHQERDPGFQRYGDTAFSISFSFFFSFHLGDCTILYGWLSLTQTDKPLNHRNKGTHGIFPGVIEKRISSLHLLPVDEQPLP